MREWRVGMAVAACLVLSVSVVSAAPPDPFTGAWRSIDNDGSNQTLAFGGAGTSRNVFLFDDGASACGWPDVLVSATLRGSGSIVDNTLTVDLDGTCHPGGQGIGAIVEFTVVNDTLVDSFGVTWYRPRP
jgi:hypothetical protein